MSRRAIAAIVAVTALLVAGCTGAPPAPTATPTGTLDPPATSTPAPTPSPTPTPTPTSPEPPADLARTDEVGAAAAATYFVSLYPEMLRTGDFSEWDRFSRPDCTFCIETRKYVDEVISAGGTFKGGTLRAELIEVHARDTLIGGYPVDVRIDQAATIQFDSAGKVVTESPDETIESRVDVLHDDLGWRILAVSDRVEG